MFRLEVLDHEEKILSTHRLNDGLTLIGQSPNANVVLKGKNIGPLHVGIRVQKEKNQTGLTLMDLGGPAPLKINGEATLESQLNADTALIEIGNRKLRIVRAKSTLPEVKKQKWIPLVEEKTPIEKQKYAIRARIYHGGQLIDVVNSTSSFVLKSDLFNLDKDHRMVWVSGKNFFMQLPSEWKTLGGRVSSGSRIAKIDEYLGETSIDANTVYRVQSGFYTIEILISRGQVSIGAEQVNRFPKELRMPFGISSLVIVALFTVWTILSAQKEAPVEEPYKVYARIQNIPVEKILEEPDNQPQGGGGSGSPNQQTTAPQAGSASKLAQSLTGGLTNLVGSMLGQAKTANAVVSEAGLASAASAAASVANTGTKVGMLASVGTNKDALTGAAKLGKLGIAGSGQGFSGGSGTGLGTGMGSGIGSGVGNGIGRGSYKLVEEESIVDGGLDKSVIAAVIQNNLAQIKYCYERQLVAEPDLFGKVVVNWQINAGGTVQNTSIKQTTLNSNPVEQCMMGKISGWIFPKPKNGTMVSVSYPFLFKSTK